MRLRSARGAITIQVAFSLIALIAFSTLVVDNGVVYVSRRQAQTAADAGALAGAETLMLTPTNTTLATQAAKYFASHNQIWGEQTADADIIVSPLPYNCPDGVPSCIRVDVFRGIKDRANNPHTNTLPTYFASMVTSASQGTRATATAQVAAGNAVSCIKPWVVADKWIDTGTGATGGLLPGAWDQMDTFDPAVDSYTAPGFKATGPDNDYGTELVLKEGVNGTWSSGWTMQVDFGATGSSVYRDEISGCPDFVPTVGLYNGSIPCSEKGNPTDPVQGCLSVKTGMAAGPTSQGVADLIALDPSATWDPSTKTVTNSCMATGTCTNPTGSAAVSARIAPLAIFNTSAFATEAAGNDCSGSTCVAQVVNLLGFFIEGMCNDVYPDQATRPEYCGTPSEANKAVVGRLMSYPGQVKATAGSAGPFSFLKVIRLIR